MIAGGGINVGDDTVFGTSSTETLTADGSGQASFANCAGGSVTAPQGSDEP